jgi:Xaa-Pro aminopeptidase
MGQLSQSRSARRTALGASLSGDLAGLLVTGWENVRYLAGFTGSSGALFVDPNGDARLATDARYLLQAAIEAPDLEVVESKRPGPALLASRAERGPAVIGIEASHVTLTELHGLQAAAGETLRLVETDGQVAALRAVKDPDEIAALRRACQITDAAFTDVVLRLAPGVTERQVADRLYAAMRAHGAEAAAFDTIVAFGPNSAIPHHQPTDRELAPGDLIKTDFGARYDGYHADLTRTVVLGPAADWQRELHGQVAEIQRAAVASAVPGAMPGELDAAATAAIQATGHRACHGLGHGVGLQIHEDPYLTATSTAGPLVPGMVITVEPGIYLEGRGGVRVEDTGLITGSGFDPLTRVGRSLVEI